MATVTEKDIIAHFKEKANFHQREAKRIESILSAFASGLSSAKAKSNSSGEATRDTTPQGNNDKVKVKSPVATKPLQVPQAYQPKLTLNSKIAYILSQLTSGTVEEIAAKIVELQPEQDKMKVMQQLSGVLSTLKKKGQLTAVKQGRKDEFSLVL